MVESLLKQYPNVLTLRVRMPIVADLVYPRNFITKIIKYDKVVDIPNSMTVLPELLPMSIEMVSSARGAPRRCAAGAAGTGALQGGGRSGWRRCCTASHGLVPPPADAPRPSRPRGA
jgi:hypothetical protein